jgi:glycosyltransferase involved in cell wall biosynthesis
MRILHVNKFLYRRGGAEGYMEDVAALQAAAGHDVAFWGMAHPENELNALSSHFPSYVEMDPVPTTVMGKARAVGRIMWSPSSRRGMVGALDEHRPDLVHLHNVYQHLSPSILRPLRARGVPTVMTLHDYKLACPTYQFLDHGKVCEACLGGHFHRAVQRRCKNGSLGASAVNAVELAVHTSTRAYDPVDVFVCPSRFMAVKMAEAGVYPERMRHVPHFVDTGPLAVKEEAGGGVVYAGRLSPEKGVDTLIGAMALLPAEATLDVAGDGEQRAALAALAERLAPGRVRFRGRLGKADLHALLRSSAVLAMPSRWYENQPMIVLEAFGCGLPVVGTDLGGTPELVAPGIDGALAPADDPAALAEALAPLLARPETALAMGWAGRDKVEREFSPSSHLERLDAVYAEAGGRRGRAGRRAAEVGSG